MRLLSNGSEARLSTALNRHRITRGGVHDVRHVKAEDAGESEGSPYGDKERAGVPLTRCVDGYAFGSSCNQEDNFSLPPFTIAPSAPLAAFLPPLRLAF
jgi:hypothetical protein